MAKAWADVLWVGRKTWKQVPNARKAAVEAVMREDVANGYQTAERFEEITGIPYDTDN